MKTILIIIGALAALIVPLSWLMFYGMREIKQLVIREVDLGHVADGVYRGSYHKGRWAYDVEVIVRDHRIVAVKNKSERMEVASDWNAKAEAAIVEKQAIDLDVISGATVNTKAFEKAVERALSAPTKP